MDVAQRVRAGVSAGEWPSVRLLLHPYLRWELPDGRIVRGRTNVLAMLTEGGVPPGPVSVELRDGQVYRWAVDRRGAEGD